MILHNREPKRLLKELEITEVSLVDEGANPGAWVTFWKSEHGARKLWEDYIDEVLSVHNKKLKERKANPPKFLSSDQVENLRLEKPWSRQQASQEARKTGFGQQLWAMLQQEAQPPLAKGERMYKSLGEIAKAIDKGEIKSQEDALKELDELRDRDIAKSDFAKSEADARYEQTTDPAWNSLYNAFMNLPKTVEEGKAFEKRQKESELIVKTINIMAGKLVQKEGITKEKAFGEVLKRYPLLEATYREFY